MTKILLAGIGTGRYESTAYDFGGGQLITSRFFFVSAGSTYQAGFDAHHADERSKRARQLETP